jgi:hypothetical protein
MTISHIYRVSVIVPEPVWDHFGHTSTYDRASLKATAGNLSAGRNSYSEVEEWAEFDTLEDAKECERRLVKVIEDFLEVLK